MGYEEISLINLIPSPGIKTTSRTGNGGLGQYVTWTWFVLSPPFPVRDVGLIPGLLLHGCEIKSVWGLGTKLCIYIIIYPSSWE